MEKDASMPEDAPKVERRGRPPKKPAGTAHRTPRNKETQTGEISQQEPVVNPVEPVLEANGNQEQSNSETPDYDNVQPEAVKMVRTVSLNRKYSRSVKNAPISCGSFKPRSYKSSSISSKVCIEPRFMRFAVSKIPSLVKPSVSVHFR